MVFSCWSRMNLTCLYLHCSCRRFVIWRSYPTTASGVGSRKVRRLLSLVWLLRWLSISFLHYYFLLLLFWKNIERMGRGRFCFFVIKPIVNIPELNRFLATAEYWLLCCVSPFDFSLCHSPVINFLISGSTPGVIGFHRLYM